MQSLKLQGLGTARGRGPTSVPEIDKTERDREIIAPDRGDNRLQLVFTFALHAHFLALDLRGDLEFAVAKERGNLPGHGGLDALLNADGLAAVAERREFR